MKPALTREFNPQTLTLEIVAVSLWLLNGVCAQELPLEKLTLEYLPNAIRIHSRVISGGLPADERAFQQLQSLGVKTLISVDGAEPNVSLAHQFGMRYVHLPHGYDGISEDRLKELAKALQELEGPIYIHCHHGQHRSPAAAAAGCIAAGLIDPTSGLELLRRAGTNPNYRGLFRVVSQAQPLPTAELDRLQIDFVERAKVPPLAAAMVALEHTFDNLKQLSRNRWQSSAAHPDLESTHEGLLLREHFVEMLRTEETTRRPEGYRQMLRDAQQLAAELETAVGQVKTGDSARDPLLHATRLLESLSANCRDCHAQFRDTAGD